MLLSNRVLNIENKSYSTFKEVFNLLFRNVSIHKLGFVLKQNNIVRNLVFNIRIKPPFTKYK